MLITSETSIIEHGFNMNQDLRYWHFAYFANLNKTLLTIGGRDHALFKGSLGISRGKVWQSDLDSPATRNEMHTLSIHTQTLKLKVAWENYTAHCLSSLKRTPYWNQAFSSRFLHNFTKTKTIASRDTPIHNIRWLVALIKTIYRNWSNHCCY